MLSDACIRAGWEAERENIRKDLLAKEFAPKSVEKAVSNFIDSMVFAKLPCTTKAGVIGSAEEYLPQVSTWRRH